jgi:hypothetical protein
MATKTPNIRELLQPYGCGALAFVGTENALYERHLVFDRAIDPKVASAREQFEAFAHVCTRWTLGENNKPRMSNRMPNASTI